MALFTVETAREFSARSVAVRKQRALERNKPFVPQLVPATAPTDQFSNNLAQACDETLAKVIVMVRKEKTSQCAQLARALRDLRETWHLATGKPRPGLTRPQEDGRGTRREIPRVYPGDGGAPPNTGQPT